MTTISAKIVESSISPAGVRLDTFELHYPDWFHGEFLTHRDFSRNAASIRAIPTLKLIQAIEADPAVPLHWGLNEPGMQANKALTDAREISAARGLWLAAMRKAISSASELAQLFKLHKQVAGRLLAPWKHMDVVATATNWENFFALRCHPQAEPHIRILAWRMADAYYRDTKPKRVDLGQWHLPYVRPEERTALSLEDQKVCSTARCARVSYRTHTGENATLAKDKDLYTKLLAGLASGEELEPGHMSPFEHQATPLEDPAARSGNFRGWLQHRKTIPGEAMSFNYDAAVAKGWRDIANECVPS